MICAPAKLLGLNGILHLSWTHRFRELMLLGGKKNRSNSKAAGKGRRTGRKRKNTLGAKSRGHTEATLGIQSRSAALLQLICALNKARVPYQIIGMGAAVLQGVPVVTQDLDLWIGRPMSGHDEILLICHNLGAKMLDDFRVLLPDTTLVNFTYHVDGLGRFSDEVKKSRRLKLFGQRIPVLPLERIYASKAAVKRPKDRVHLFYLRQAMRLQGRLKRRR